ncbi:MAG: trigger factor [Flavobacteriales bacterium]|nr:trigger factor [Flavobacteriales bacterium]MCB9448433.1 trigger factor [Flavobacteriales bacterium]
MEIVKEPKGELGAILKVKVTPEDYAEQVNKAVKEYRKKVSMPGFRPGMVPPSLIKKMYGKSIIVEEVNGIVSKSLNEYISTNNLQILGYPILEDESQEVIWEENKPYEFNFELGLSPEIKVDFGAQDKVKKYKVAADDEMIGKEVMELRKRYGQVTKVDDVQEEDFVFGEFVELDDAGQEKEGGIRNHASVMVHKVPDEATKKKLVGLKKDTAIEVDPRKLASDEKEVPHMLGIDAAALGNVGSRFRFTITQISRVQPAEVNQEFFDKIFGENEVTTEEVLREKIKEGLENQLSNDSDSKLKYDLVDHLLAKIKIPLPDEFLRRWMVQASKDENAATDVDKHYEQYARGLRWQLVENQIIKDNSIQVSHDEALGFAKQRIQAQLAYYGQGAIPDEDLHKYAHQLIHNEEEGRKIYDQLYDEKVFDLVRNQVTLVEKEVSFKEFVNLVENKKEEKSGFFNFGFRKNKK